MLAIGKKAPQFTLFDSDGNKVSLKDFLGRYVVLYFYPKDMTPGCTKEACDFRDSFSAFDELDAVVVGVSPDSIESHKKFKEKYNLPFILLSDESKKVLIKYGVWKEKKLYGRKYMGVERTTVLIDEKGIVRKIFNNVKVEGHIAELIRTLNQS
ncbi:thioredoxin-dependent thiol peroxidase [Melioribacteraceae bacterium 4301-Me]|uniref:thioredoxin-dependent thiol peroxidase n=1 Tax=Pyranulibacter aquaticus TaxID=3163344 RepID=UPI003599D40B